MKVILLMISLLFSGISFAGPVEDVFGANDKLFNALLGTDQSKVELAAKEMAAIIQKDNSAKLKSLKGNIKSLQEMTAKNTKEKNIELYDKVAAPLVALRREGKVGTYEIYYCPMVKKHWVQNQKTTPDVRNVFAQYMLECGELSK